MAALFKRKKVEKVDFDQYEKEIIKASESLKKVVSSVETLSTSERVMLEEDIQELENMLQKLDNSLIEITAFGEVSTGKSALLNALLRKKVFPTGAEHGKTKEIHAEDWNTLVHESRFLANSCIRLVDTPGLNEVDGSHRAEMAKKMSLRSDMILFVVDSDLNHIEHEALIDLGKADKPIIVVLNKTDIMSEKQVNEIRESILKDKLPPQVMANDLINASADPKEKEVTVVRNGKEHTALRQPKPDVEDVKLRILEYLKRDGKGLVALNGAMFASDVSDKIVRSKIELRKQEAEKVVWKYAAGKASAAALIPVPVIDLIGAGVADVRMVIHLGKIYGFEIKKLEALNLWKRVLLSNIPLFGAEWLSHMLSGSAKISSFGLSIPATASAQALAAGLGSYLVGHATRVYFANNESWGPGGPKKVIRDILEHTNTDLVKDRLGELIETKIGRNKGQFSWSGRFRQLFGLGRSKGAIR